MFVATVVFDVTVVAIVAAETTAIVVVLVERNWMHPEHHSMRMKFRLFFVSPAVCNRPLTLKVLHPIPSQNLLVPLEVYNPHPHPPLWSGYTCWHHPVLWWILTPYSTQDSLRMASSAWDKELE